MPFHPWIQISQDKPFNPVFQVFVSVDKEYIFNNLVLRYVDNHCVVKTAIFILFEVCATTTGNQIHGIPFLYSCVPMIVACYYIVCMQFFHQ